MADVLSKEQKLLSCSICLDQLRDPVTIPCGHNYCMGCIEGCWDGCDQKGVYSCPQCRRIFNPRPVLYRNTMLAELVEKFKQTRLQTSTSVHDYAGPGDVACDCCSERKLKAIKSCLMCLASYCETHVQPHYESPAFKKHKLVKASAQLREQICSEHDKLLEVYCRTDQQCICMLCTLEKHKSHDTESAAAERAEKQKSFGDTQRKLRQRIQEGEKRLQELREALVSHKKSAQAAVEDSERIFTELISSIERKRSEVTELIRAQEKAAVNQTERYLKQLEQEIADLRKKNTDLEQFSHTEDHIQLVQAFQSACGSTECQDLSRITINPRFTYEKVIDHITKLKEHLDNLCHQDIITIKGEVRAVDVIQPKDFLKYSCRLTLDPNTAHRKLQLSEGNTKATATRQFQSYPDHPERFETWAQVLCRESVSKRCYWEVEWTGPSVYIAISYKDIKRKGTGKESKFGCNDQSWRLDYRNDSYSFWHNNTSIEIPAVCSTSRIGVYVDYSAGTLSFYSVSDRVTLLHRVQTTFTKPLYPGFWFYDYGSSVKICDLQ
ncbi:E3 ubiquitin/ISG15 ligase TRIM25-like [Chanos chanos]|uniref:E3 ubiquitin/ISG15 ligase TRIM25-like n=1 Tax=Chanos chanos TaxID=29144 RepID=A0A6J2URY2_CHACN|nr:E3 ubiquitin/ISG15 ligase TRIM25-like [Chanos chanos]